MGDPAGEAAAGGLDLIKQHIPFENRLNRWQVTVWDRAGEASVTLQTYGEPSLETLAERAKRGQADDPERAAQEAARRAGAVVRRYVVSHGCTRQVTLTFNDYHLPEDLAGGWAAVEDFRRKLGKRLGPMLVVPEWGEKNGRLHFHCLVPRYLPQREYEEAWGRGWVDIRKIKSNRSRGPRGARSDARVAAFYAAKYLSKAFAEGQSGREFNGKRYSTTKGTKVEPGQRCRFRSQAEALTWAVYEQAGGFGNISSWWSSNDQADWDGPPVVLMMWDHEADP